jgi:monoamine oxidase
LASCRESFVPTPVFASGAFLPLRQLLILAVERTSVQVAIVGAGVAGLEAARVLHEAGVEFIVLEARERIGGRVFTVHDEHVAVPIELGAEFVHGSAPELRAIARLANSPILDIAGERWQSTSGTLRRLDDFWSLLDGVMQHLNAKHGPDRSFQQFLNTKPGGRRLAHARSFALQWVEGFHAADPTRISAHALADGGSPGDEVREQRIGRFIDGYDAVAKWIVRDVTDRLRLGAVVTAVNWQPGGVSLDVRQPNGESVEALSARAAILTVPLGVLQAPPGEPGAIAINPPLEGDNAKAESIGGMDMGSVMRVTLALREPFWTSERFARRAKSESLDRLDFVHTNDGDFPVWWTHYPVSAPMLVAWVGGKRARAVASLDDDQAVSRAVDSLARQFRMSRREAGRLVTGAWLHNWQKDPYARGAYSYIVVDAGDAPAKLARPIQRTLFFAGEASDTDGRTGTVHGAIATGRRAAKQVMRVL